VFPGVLLTCTDPIPGAKEGKNADLGGAVERCRNMGPGAALEVECATGAAADGFAQMKKCAVEPVTAAEGDAQGGASTVERMRTLLPAGARFFTLNSWSYIIERGSYERVCGVVVLMFVVP